MLTHTPSGRTVSAAGRALLSLVVIATLVFPQNGFPALPAGQQVQLLSGAYDSMVYDKTSYAALEYLIAETNRTVSDPGFDGNAAEVHALALRKKKAENFLAASRALDGCLTDPRSPRNLKERIREAMGAGALVDPCTTPAAPEAAASLAQAGEQVNAQVFAQSLRRQAEANSFLTFLDASARFNAAPDLSAIVSEFCASRGTCDADQRERLGAAGASYLAALPPPERNETPEDAAARITQNLTQAQAGTASPPTRGDLLLGYTDAIQKKFKARGKVGAADLAAAQSEIKNEIKGQVQLLASMEGAKSVQDTERDLRRLVKSNPAAVGQILLQHPEFAVLTCRLIREIEHEDDTDARWNRVFFWGGAIVGGALLVSGVFSLAGAGVLAAVGAGEATLAAVSTVATISLAAGGVASLADAGYEGYRAYAAHESYQDLERAVLSGNGDAASVEEKEKQLSLFKESTVKAAISLGLSAVDLGPLFALAKAGKLADVTLTLNRIVGDASLSDLMRRAGQLLSREKMAGLLKYWAELPKEQAEALFASMKSWTPEKLVSFANGLKNASLQAAKNYAGEVRASPYYSRLIWASRDTTQSRNIFKNPTGWIFNPIATARNSATQLSIPAQSVAAIALFDLPKDYLNQRLQDKNLAAAERIAPNLPGGDFAMDFAKKGLVDPAAISQTILGHNQALEAWARSTGQDLLPRAQEMVRLGILRPAETSHFNDLCRQALAEATASTKAGPKAAQVDDILANMLMADPIFTAKPAEDLEALSSAFWPNVKIKNRSDLELTQALVSSTGRGATAPAQQASLRNIRDLLAQGSIELTQADALAAATLDEPRSISEKIDGDPRTLRPDFPFTQEELRFETGGKTEVMRNERDRWRILRADPRFAEIEAQREQGAIDAYHALEDEQLMIKGLNQIAELAPKDRPISLDAARTLLGMNPNAGLNPLFADVAVKLYKNQTSRGLNDEQQRRCDLSLVGLWVGYYRSVNQLAAEPASPWPAKKDLDQRALSEESALLEHCG